MAKGHGYQGIVGLRKAPTWGTAAAAGATHGLEVNAVDIEDNRGIIARSTITGRVTRLEGDKGNLEVGGPIRLPLRYEGVGILLALLHGTAGVPATVDTSARLHTFKIADSVDGLFATLAYELLKDTTIFEFNTLKITRISIKWQLPGHVMLEVETIGMDFTDASAINTTTTIDTVTLPANNEICQARHLVVRLNAQAGGALGAGDVAYCTSGELTITRPLERDFTTEFSDRSSEPMPPQGDGAFASVTGSLTFSQYQTGTGGNNVFVAEQLARTLKKMDWTFTGETLVGAATAKTGFGFFFPKVVFGSGKPKLSAGAMGWTLPFESHHVAVAPTGFTAGFVDAVTITNQNALTGDVLA